MRILSTIACALLFVVALGCHTSLHGVKPGPDERIRVGMTTDSVRAIMGDPNRVPVAGPDMERWEYDFYRPCQQRHCQTYLDDATLVFREGRLEYMYDMPGWHTRD